MRSAAHAAHAADQHAVLGRADARHEHLVVAAAQPAGRKPARERQLHLFHVAGRKPGGLARHGGVDRPAIMPGDVGHVLGRLEPAFDFQGAGARGDQLRHERVGGQVLRAEQVLHRAQVDLAAVADQLIGQAAGLGALAAIGAAAAERFAGQALARIGDAQRAVNEHLQRHRGLAVDVGDFVDRQFPGQDHPFDPQPRDQLDRLGAGERHLRGGVDGEIRRNGFDQPHGAQVLDQDGVDPGRRDLADGLFELGQFAGKHQRVERHVSPHSAAVDERHHVGELVGAQIGGPGAGVEARVEAEIHGVGAVFDRRADAVEIACRRQ